MVLGGHGDEMVPLTSYTSVGGIPIGQLLDPASIEALVKRTRTGGAEIVSLLKTGQRLLRAGRIGGQDGGGRHQGREAPLPGLGVPPRRIRFKDIYLGVPVLMGRNGVERIVELPLSESERAALDASAEAVRKGIAEISSLREETE